MQLQKILGFRTKLDRVAHWKKALHMLTPQRISFEIEEMSLAETP